MSVQIDGLDTLRRSWGENGLGWVTDVIGVNAGSIDVMLYYGSSVYDTAQMARLIDLIIAECKVAGVEYLPPDKINAMLEEWDAKNKESGGA